MTCNCRSCQINKKSPEVRYAYYTAKYETAKHILKVFEKQGIKFSFTELANGKKGLNELGCIAYDDVIAYSVGIMELVEEHPELKNFWKKENENV